jgi:hypothetical protein
VEFERIVNKISKTNPSHIPLELVQSAAYFRWEKRGRPHGDPLTDWLHAEREVAERLKHPQEHLLNEPPSESKDEPGHSWSA